jgi:hypothetical protein
LRCGEEPSAVAAVTFGLACVFLTLPIFATYFALRVKNLIVAAVLTWVALCLPPVFTTVFMDQFSQLLESAKTVSGFLLLGSSAFFFLYVVFALLACFLLRHSLSRRIYSF